MTENILNKLTLDFLSETQPLWGYVQAETAGCVISFLALVTPIHSRRSSLEMLSQPVMYV